MISKSGIYCPNTKTWQDSERRNIEQGGFTWAVCRTDTSLSEALWLHEHKMTIIMQLPDYFGNNYWSDPGIRAKQILRSLDKFKGVSMCVALDNEPNLAHDGCRNWFAEQFCRWYRALVACFRFYSPGSHWKIIFPGICMAPQRNWQYWIKINSENISESYGLGIHSYWQTESQLNEQIQLLRSGLNFANLPLSNLFVLEYSNSFPEADEQVKINQYTHFIRSLPHAVRCAAMFIGGGTDQWHNFWLTPRLARALSEV